MLTLEEVTCELSLSDELGFGKNRAERSIAVKKRSAKASRSESMQCVGRAGVWKTKARIKKCNSCSRPNFYLLAILTKSLGEAG